MTDLEKAKNIIEKLWNIIDDIDSYVFYRKIFLTRFLDKGNYRFP